MCASHKLTRSSATAKGTAHPVCLVGVLYDIYRETNNRSTLVRNWPRNLPGIIKAITPFKVVQGHQFRY